MDGINVYDQVNIAGQTISYGQAWWGNQSPSGTRVFPTTIPIGYPAIAPVNGFISHGTPFNVYQWFRDNFEEMPTATEYHYFDDSGECHDYDAWKLVLAIVYVGSKAYFIGTTHAESNPYQLVTNLINQGGYAGADPDNMTAQDIEMANVYFYIPDRSYTPDITNIKPSSGGEPYQDTSGKVLSVMNYELRRVDDNSYQKVVDMYIGEPMFLTNSLDAGVIFCGPNPADTSWAYYRTSTASWKMWEDGLPSFMLNDLQNYTDEEASPGGGYGDYGYYSDSLGFSDLPTIGAEDTGFTVMYAPTLSEVKNLASYMWTSNFVDNLIKAISTDPIKAVINFGFVPLDLTAVRGSQQSVVIGNLDTGVQMSKLTEQYISIDMGHIDLTPRWDTALMFEPYTIIECFLPFVGFVQLPTSEVYRPSKEGPARIAIQYNVNLFTGEFVAEITCTIHDITMCLFQHTGTMMYQVPLTGSDYSSFYKNVLGAAVRVIPAAMGGPAMAATATVTGALSAAVTPMQVQRSGAISGGASIMGAFGAFLVIRQAVQHFDVNAHSQLVGYPSYLFRSLGKLSGYTVCDSVKMDGFTGTAEEAAELEQLLKGGVYL